MSELETLRARVAVLEQERDGLIHQRDFWEQRYETQHRTVHSMEDEIAAGRARIVVLREALQRIGDEAEHRDGYLPRPRAASIAADALAVDGTPDSRGLKEVIDEALSGDDAERRPSGGDADVHG